MDSETISAILSVAVMLGVYMAFAGLLLFIGDNVSRRSKTRTRSGLPFAVHALAVLGFLIGSGLAWTAYSGDRDLKERYYLLPIVLPAIAYAGALIIAVEGGVIGFVFNKLRSLISGRGS
jgi:hypothetical protein